MQRVSMIPMTLTMCLLSPITIHAEDKLPTAAPREVGMSPEKLAEIDHVMQSFLDMRQLAGAVTIVARRGKVIQFKAYGKQDLAANKRMERDTEMLQKN